MTLNSKIITIHYCPIGKEPLSPVRYHYLKHILDSFYHHYNQINLLLLLLLLEDDDVEEEVEEDEDCEEEDLDLFVPRDLPFSF
mmetsp:Transcript_30783/g.61972  ORF Transcript_30783/g.61972 Transcript_30783/m.61972 type:complete len:84 (+) Transcript_30783:311-562(+)